jgi:hypothetical protein
VQHARADELDGEVKGLLEFVIDPRLLKSAVECFAVRSRQVCRRDEPRGRGEGRWSAEGLLVELAKTVPSPSKFKEPPECIGDNLVLLVE